MNRSTLAVAGFLLAVFASGQAFAWSHSTAYGHTSGGGGSWTHSGDAGTASGGDGSWSASGNRGGSASGGDGSWSGTGYRGGTASGGDGSWNAQGANGGTASGGDGTWNATGPDGNSASGYHTSGSGANYYGTAYYHPPAAVYHGSGCYGCGGAAVAGAAVGAGAVMASQQNTYVSNSENAYQAGVAAAPPQAMPIGASYAALPPGCAIRTVSGGTYYQCGSSWLQPTYGANGVFYTVVMEPY